MEELFPEELPPDFPEFPPLNPPPKLEFDPEPEPFPELPPEFELEPEPFPPEPEPFPEGFVVVTVVTVVVCVSEEFPECSLKLSELELVVFFGIVVSLPVFVVVLPVSVNFPDLGIELPVQSEWSYPALKISPCRYKGSILTGDLILAAHNYQSHFGRIQELNTGAEILLTDGNGEVHHYEVVQTEIIPGQDVEAMEFGSAENWDLTLFTCTLSGQSRVTVRAVEKTI